MKYCVPGIVLVLSCYMVPVSHVYAVTDPAVSLCWIFNPSVINAEQLGWWRHVRACPTYEYQTQNYHLQTLK